MWTFNQEITYQRTAQVKPPRSRTPMICSLSSCVDWSLYSVLTKSKNGLIKVQKPGNLPLSVYAGVLGMPGMTAFLSLRAFAKLKAGETLFVSTAAGVVGRYAFNLHSSNASEGLRIHSLSISLSIVR